MQVGIQVVRRPYRNPVRQDIVDAALVAAFREVLARSASILQGILVDAVRRRDPLGFVLLALMLGATVVADKELAHHRV